MKNKQKSLRKLDAAKSRLFANISHELRTPLTLILGPVGTVLKNAKLNGKESRLLSAAQTSGRNLLALINSILDLSKMEAGKIELQEEQTYLFPFLRRIVSAFESYAEQRKIVLSFQYTGAENILLNLDKEKVKIILNNLLSNAMKFTEPEGKVSVHIEDPPDTILISVTDTGRGIHAEDLSHVFDRFYQSNQPDAPVEGGTGIGLALCKEYVMLMGGKIWVESVMGEGSTFFLQLPKREITESTETNQPKGLPAEENNSVFEDVVISYESEKPSSIADRPVVLIVEDNKDLRYYIQMLLEPFYTTLTAENGKIAWELLCGVKNTKQQMHDTTVEVHEVMPSLIVSDIMMPVMDGYEFLAQLKQHDHFVQIPVIMLTARADIQDKLRALRIGVDDYLLKPFDEEELLARIVNLLNNVQRRAIIAEQDVAYTSQEQENGSLINAADQQWLEQLELCVLANINNTQFSTEFLAKEMHISRRQLQRRIKKHTGLSPKEYINEVRLQQVRKMIETGKITSAAAATYEAGFSNLSYFSRLFKERFGKTPAQYIKSCRIIS